MTDESRNLRDTWLLLAAKATGSGSVESLYCNTPDGFDLPPLATPEPEDAPLFVPRSASVRHRDWDLRTELDTPAPDAANAVLLADLEGGASSALIEIGRPERAGVMVAAADDLAQVLDGVALDATPIALNAGFDGLRIADFLAMAARRSPMAKLAFHLDPLGAMAETGSAPAAADGSLRPLARAGMRHVAAFPQATLFMASGRAVHEAGGSDSQELGFMAAAALAYAKAVVNEGCSLGEAFPLIVLGLSIDANMFASLAKLRAARLLWSRLTDACGSPSPARIEARSSRRMLSRDDPWLDLLRCTAAVFAGAAGGADAIVLEAFARRQVRGVQLVLMEEAGLGRVADPASGSWYLDRYARQLARSGWNAFQEIERAGGAWAALKSGFVAGSGASAGPVRPAARLGIGAGAAA